MGILKCVCISKQEHQSAKNIHQNNVTPSGLSGDIHCGNGVKQISMLPYEVVKYFFEQKNEPICYGRFGENLVVEGLDWSDIHVGDKFRCEDVMLEVSKIGAQWEGMEEFTEETVCSPMEEFFVFCRVKHAGILTEGEPIYKD